MTSVVEKMHKKNISLDLITSKFESRFVSCTKCLSSHDRLSQSESQSQGSTRSTINSGSERSNISGHQDLHMFGDISRSVIVSRVCEKENENLKDVMLHCFRDINLNIVDNDIETVERIGTYDCNQRWPRPFKVIFTTSVAHDQVLFFKLRLRNSTIYHEFKISKEVPKELRVNRAKLRQAANIAKERGHIVFTRFDSITIDEIEYNLQNIETIPQEFRIKNRHNFEPSDILLTLEEKCTFKSSKIIIFVGPSLQKNLLWPSLLFRSLFFE